MRYFIGVTFPEETITKIDSFRKEFKSNKLPEIFEPHITIKYRSGLFDDMIWLNKVKPIIENYPSFDVDFNGIGTFPGVIILKIEASKPLMSLHNLLYNEIKPDENDPTMRCFEGEKYIPHSTLGMQSWGMTAEELSLMREQAEAKLVPLPKFKVSFLRVYRQEKENFRYEKLIDIPLK